ncbi:MAG: hypothetical protein E7404_09355 [Ruminococcaceae bacterium]|nr:hypothetical protein [Oscillospiraceae bacterium]
MKKILSSILALVLILSTIFSVNVFAASDTYIATAQINVYKDTKCKTRGTVSPAKAYNAYISKEDDVNIQKLTSSYAKVDYPTSSGRKTGYIKRSDYNTKLKKYTPVSNSYSDKMQSFLKDSRFKNGATWKSSQKPKLSSYSCSGCCAYAADFAKYVFGKKSPTSGTKFTNPKDIKSGDVIKVTGSQHWFVVLERNGQKLKTAEGNWNGKVVVSSSAYTVKNNTLYRNGKKFRTFAAGYHFQ